jgi:DNA-directed RNA polymerase specialized sigma24 family protein
MVGDALIKMVKALREQKFNPDRGNPFSYFTKIAFHAFCNRIKKEKKNKDTLIEYQNSTCDTLIEAGYLTGNSQKETEDTNKYENF